MRSLNPNPFNEIACHPECRPWLGIPANIEPDLSLLVSNPANFCFLTDSAEGGYILHKLHPGLYAAHTMSKPSARGRPMVRLMHQGFRFMFAATDCLEITTLVPDGAQGAASWAKLAGFRPMYRREAFFPLMDEMVGGSFQTLGYGDWALRDQEALRLGMVFHEAIAAQGAHVDHAEDDIHDRWVGATLMGCIQGNGGKAVAMYNRWAAVSGYAQASVITLNPFVVDIRSAVVHLIDGRIEVLRLSA